MDEQIAKIKNFFTNKLQTLNNGVAAKKKEISTKYPNRYNRATTFAAVLFLIILTILVVLILTVYADTLKKRGGSLTGNIFNNNLSSTPSPTPKPTIKPLPKGRQIYNYSHGDQVTGPKPSSATIDPIDPNLNEEQYLSIKVEHDKEVKSAVATVITDNQQKEYKMELISGTKTNGVWGAKWKMRDSYKYKYQIEYIFKSGNEIHEGALTFR